VKFFDSIELSLCTNGRLQEFRQFCHGEPWNFANWSLKYRKIFRGKMWPLIIRSKLPYCFMDSDVLMFDLLHVLLAVQ